MVVAQVFNLGFEVTQLNESVPVILRLLEFEGG